MKRLILGFLVLALSACGSSTSPSSTSNVAGTWAGPFGFTVNPAPGKVFTLRAVLVQSGSTVTGTWTASDSFSVLTSGNVSGNVNGTTFAGSLTQTGSCSPGNAVFSASTANPTAMTWTSASGFTNAPSSVSGGCDTSSFNVLMMKQ